ncbi:MAG: hypothetical protein HC837_11090 [Chloroflexaceae bacterium]|nr:hypothetical protein [Chloroflexaceae bacterium]
MVSDDDRQFVVDLGLLRRAPSGGLVIAKPNLSRSDCARSGGQCNGLVADQAGDSDLAHT